MLTKVVSHRVKPEPIKRTTMMNGIMNVPTKVDDNDFRINKPPNRLKRGYEIERKVERKVAALYENKNFQRMETTTSCTNWRRER
jgi:hypothetical protein